MDSEMTGEDEHKREHRRPERITDPSQTEAVAADYTCSDEEDDQNLRSQDRPERERDQKEGAVTEGFRISGERRTA
jgi:hypothetical protein